MDQRAQNPMWGLIALFVGFIILFIVYAFFSGPLGEVWAASENASTNPNTPDVWGGLSHVWLMIGVLFVIFVSVWFFAYMLKREREAEVFLG